MGGMDKDNKDRGEFIQCCRDACIKDMRFISLLYTQSNKKERDETIACKFNPTLINEHWINSFLSNQLWGRSC